MCVQTCVTQWGQVCEKVVKKGIVWHVDMCVGVCVDLCAGIWKKVSLNTCIDMCVDMAIRMTRQKQH